MSNSKISYENILRSFTYSNDNAEKALCDQRWNNPTIDISKGEVRVCCRVPAYKVTKQDLVLGADAVLNNTFLKERRLEMFSGVKHKDCAPCWKAEASGHPSPRSGTDKVLKRLKSLYPEDSMEQAIAKLDINSSILFADDIRFLEVQMGNHCDLKCVYCWRGNSSKWTSEDYQFGRITKEEYEKLNEKASPEFTEVFWKMFSQHASTLEMISFVGGEPTLSEKFYKILVKIHEILLEAGNKTATVRIVTNNNAQPDRLNEFIDAVKLLNASGRKVLIDISMEAFGRRAEIIRYGLSWSRFQDNLVALLSADLKHTNIAFSATINALSVTSFQEFINFLAPLKKSFRLPLPFLENSVIDPIWLSPEILPPEFKEHLLEASGSLKKFEADNSYRRPDPIWGYNWQKYSEYVDAVAKSIRHPVGNEDLNIKWTRGRFSLGLRELERRRGINFGQEFPEMKSFLNYCQSLESQFEYPSFLKG